MADYQKPSEPEDEYFLLEEVEQKRKLALEQVSQMQAQQREELKQLHYMKCPKCGMDLHTLEKGKVEVDTCFNCHGIWLDAGELEQIVAAGNPQSGSVMRAVLNFIKHR